MRLPSLKAKSLDLSQILSNVKPMVAMNPMIQISSSNYIPFNIPLGPNYLPKSHQLNWSDKIFLIQNRPTLEPDIGLLALGLKLSTPESCPEKDSISSFRLDQSTVDTCS